LAGMASTSAASIARTTAANNRLDFKALTSFYFVVATFAKACQPFHHEHDATTPSLARTSQNAVNTKFA
jgi:hypothetical protein